MTGGRYDTVVIDPVTLAVRTVPASSDVSEGRSPDAVPATVEPDDLSRGAADQFYLAVRLALVELLGGREPQPVFLDDALVHFDHERRGRALDILKGYSRRHQVVLFTCDDSYCDYGERVIRLDA
jgi:uncharacterized protein YhaN